MESVWFGRWQKSWCTLACFWHQRVFVVQTVLLLTTSWWWIILTYSCVHKCFSAMTLWQLWCRVSTHPYALLVSNVTTSAVKVSTCVFVYVCAVDDMPVFAGLLQPGITVQQKFVSCGIFSYLPFARPESLTPAKLWNPSNMARLHHPWPPNSSAHCSCTSISLQKLHVIFSMHTAHPVLHYFLLLIIHFQCTSLSYCNAKPCVGP